MTIHKTDAYNSGLMPDYTVPGVVLCRTGSYVAAADDLISGDTIYIMHLPDGAMILDVVVNIPVAGPAGCTHIDVGYGEDIDEFFTKLSLATAGTFGMWGHGSGDAHMAAAGAINLILTNDEVLMAQVNSAPTSLPTDYEINFNVYYKMTGVIEDED